MYAFMLKGVSKEMTLLQPGISKPYSVTLVLIRIRFYFFLNCVIFLNCDAYFYSVSNRNFVMLAFLNLFNSFCKALVTPVVFFIVSL